MKKILLLTLISVLFSCENEKVIQLPEINNSDITELHDVSHAYLFYDETQKDSVELNRKNLISTTNWLVNVDKRLTLKQAIPHIKFLQEKKANSSHKNETAKNYFTCNDTSRKNLGFIEFTDVIYFFDGSGYEVESNDDIIHLLFSTPNKITIVTSDNKIIKTDNSSLIDDLLNSDLNESLIYLEFEDSLTFQDYISIKLLISKSRIENINISNNEFIFN